MLLTCASVRTAVDRDAGRSLEIFANWSCSRRCRASRERIPRSRGRAINDMVKQSLLGWILSTRRPAQCPATVSLDPTGDQQGPRAVARAHTLNDRTEAHPFARSTARLEPCLVVGLAQLRRQARRQAEQRDRDRSGPRVLADQRDHARGLRPRERRVLGPRARGARGSAQVDAVRAVRADRRATERRDARRRRVYRRVQGRPHDRSHRARLVLDATVARGRSRDGEHRPREGAQLREKLQKTSQASISARSRNTSCSARARHDPPARRGGALAAQGASSRLDACSRIGRAARALERRARSRAPQRDVVSAARR